MYLDSTSKVYISYMYMTKSEVPPCNRQFMEYQHQHR